MNLVLGPYSGPAIFAVPKTVVGYLWQLARQFESSDKDIQSSPVLFEFTALAIARPTSSACQTENDRLAVLCKLRELATVSFALLLIEIALVTDWHKLTRLHGIKSWAHLI